MKAALLAVVLALWALAATAQPSTWTLLGPAASRHASQAGYIVEPSSGRWQCVYPTPTSRDCIGVDAPPVLGWNEHNDALGLERSTLDASGRRDSAFVNVVRDSYAELGLMAGMGRTWPAGQLGTLRLELGFSAGLWARTVAAGTRKGGQITYCFPGNPPDCTVSEKTYEVTDLRRAVLPFVFPVLSITETNTGLGLRLAVVPTIKIGAVELVPTTTLMIQTAYSF